MCPFGEGMDWGMYHSGEGEDWGVCPFQEGMDWSVCPFKWDMLSATLSMLNPLKNITGWDEGFLNFHWQNLGAPLRGLSQSGYPIHIII